MYDEPYDWFSEYCSLNNIILNSRQVAVAFMVLEMPSKKDQSILINALAGFEEWSKHAKEN